MVRIIAGTAKGRKLKTPKSDDIRLTLDKVKGAIFNMLGEAVLGVNILDLFSGTGSLGIEALSRGAGCVTFVEQDTRNVKIIVENLETIGFSGDVVKGDVYKMPEKVCEKKYDLVLADPPYDKDLAKNLLLQLDKYNIITNSSLVLIEHSKREAITESSWWRKIKERRYGDTVVSIYKYNNKEVLCGEGCNCNISGNI
jgi:16S rRNA (guanine966-N2)-methyltransferase